MSTFTLVLFAVAAISATRGVWSPCGLSMLSSITPMTEAGRGNRFGTTAAWFVVGGVVGGTSLGALSALGAYGVQQLDLEVGARAGLGAGLAVITAAVDLGLARIGLPIFKRQVNDAWLRTYRSWVYGAGFGWQIGFGVATYIMTAGVFLTIGLAVLSGEPLLALGGGVAFGLVRGLAVFVGRSATSPARLADVHARLDRWAPVSQAAAASIQVLAAAVLATVALDLAAGAVVALALTAAWALRTWVDHSRPSSAALSG